MILNILFEGGSDVRYFLLDTNSYAMRQPEVNDIRMLLLQANNKVKVDAQSKGRWWNMFIFAIRIFLLYSNVYLYILVCTRKSRYHNSVKFNIHVLHIFHQEVPFGVR